MSVKEDNARLNEGLKEGESQFDFTLRKITEAKQAVSALGSSRAISSAQTKLDEAGMWIKFERELQENVANTGS